MTRDEFESILEELFEEGYNQALFDIQEDILDESAYNLEDEYDYYIEQMFLEHTPFHRKEFMRGILEEVPKDERKEVAKALVRKLGKNKYIKDKDHDRNGKNVLDEIAKKHAKTTAQKINMQNIIARAANRALNSENNAKLQYKHYRQAVLKSRDQDFKKSDEKISPFLYGDATHNDVRRLKAKRLKRAHDIHQRNLKDASEAWDKEKRNLAKQVLHRAKKGDYGVVGKTSYNLIDTIHKKGKENNKQRNAEQEKWIKEIRERKMKERPRSEEELQKEKENLRKEVDKYTSPENKKAMSEKPWNKLSKDKQDDLQADYAVKVATKLEPKINNSIGDKIHNLKNRLRNALDVSRAYNKASKE